MAEFGKQGGCYIKDQQDVDKLRTFVFPGGELNKKAVGLTAFELATQAGVSVPDGTVVLLAKANGAGAKDPFSKEKL
ncbi:succinate-semialdehyde dehydrogenase, partial [bacterium]|nr:succinate-semialdehyde dehydrogenase [bacterium]